MSFNLLHRILQENLCCYWFVCIILDTQQQNTAQIPMTMSSEGLPHSSESLKFSPVYYGGKTN
jgi:hypothetical protein